MQAPTYTTQHFYVCNLRGFYTEKYFYACHVLIGLDGARDALRVNKVWDCNINNDKLDGYSITSAFALLLNPSHGHPPTLNVQIVL